MSGPRCALCRGWLPALLLPPLLLQLPALPAARIARAAQPVLCAPCTPERLALCPPVPPDCPEAARQPGCGCCQICALGPGQPCGVYTARCRLGLRCHIPTDSIEPDDMPLESTEITQDQLLNYQLMFPIGQDKSVPWNSISTYEYMKAKRISELDKLKEQGPCQKELYRSLYTLVKAQQRSRGEIYKFYLPNCNRNGFYHSKQCETLLDGESAECWCVYPKNGRRIPGSPKIKGDPECQQYLSSQE
nr:insulin-like growth factor-binding protein 1 isoform X2 [Taeniopygia guttata]